MTVEEIKLLVEGDEMDGAVLIGSEDEREDYYPAIIGTDKESRVFIYDFSALVECFAKNFKKWNEGHPDYSDEEAFLDATEWVEYNVIRSLPYWGEHAPIIREESEDEDE